MVVYCIIETEDGMTIIERPPGATTQEVADKHGGVVVDPGPYDDYEEAKEALDALQFELEDEGSDLPASQPLEDRGEPDS